MTLNIYDIAKAIGSQSPVIPYLIEDVMIDSRSVVNPQATLFVALRTPNNDGHAFIRQQIRIGVRNFVVDHIPEGAPADEANFLVVPDTLKALQAIGAYCRNRLKALVVAVTGSRGKTLTKEWIYQTLSPQMSVARSPRSYNSQIGVPLSLIYAAQVTPEPQLVVIEAGISECGEMERLAAIIRPEIGIMTDITSEHDEGFATRRIKIEEKALLFRDARHIIYNPADKEVDEVLRAMYPAERLHPVVATEAGPDANKAFVEALLGLIGKTGTLVEANPIRTRLNVIEGVNNCKLIYDRFTADITSLRGALDFMRRQVAESMQHTLILAAEGFNGTSKQIARAMTEFGITRLILVGPGAERFADIPNSVSVATPAELTSDDFYNEAIMLKGSPAISLDSLYSMLEAKQHETLMEVNLDAIVHNFNFFRSKIKPTTGIICMLKAHGYGAGSVELARTLQSQGAAYLAVAVVDEGVELRKAGITMPIIVLNPRAQNHRVMFDYHLEPEIYGFDILEEIIRSAERYGISHFPVHIKLETGMRRLGFVEEEIDSLTARLATTDSVKVATVFTHLACADDPAEDAYTESQFALFHRCCDRIDSMLAERPKRHILNSTGIIRFPDRQCDYVRLGIGLYGIPTVFDGSEADLRNVSTLTSPIISLKHWRKGDSVGYNRRGILERDSVIATVPIGYADGIDRHLGNGRAMVLVNGHRCPTVGNICMDICMIDVTDVECSIGDRVEFFGDNILPSELAAAIDTIPYEILTSISPRVKRVYFRE